MMYLEIFKGGKLIEWLEYANYIFVNKIILKERFIHLINIVTFNFTIFKYFVNIKYNTIYLSYHS